MTDLYEKFPNISEHTKWYLDEIVYCFEHYENVSSEDAIKMTSESENLRFVIETMPEYMGHETAFYWAMCIKYGFDSHWWQGNDLEEQGHKYALERHHPPRD